MAYSESLRAFSSVVLCDELFLTVITAEDPQVSAEEAEKKLKLEHNLSSLLL